VCTLSFIPDKDGYVAAMNRDEQRSRAAAFPPAMRQAGEGPVLYPQEAGGGTWIGGNSHGNLLALLNWYSMEKKNLGEKSRSRGELIPELLLEPDAASTYRALWHFDFTGIHPFRLFGIFPANQVIHEWRWDAERLTTKFHGWGRHHWFSSSWSDERAETERGSTFERAWRVDATDFSGWLRQLHASHIPEPGPYSICVHREDAATVSYTEVRFGQGELQMRYSSGNPCQSADSPGTWSIPARGHLSPLG
jgi:transport and Golgi organization protein 2